MRKLFFVLAWTLFSITNTVYAETAPAPATMTLSTTGFLDQGAMPVVYTCDGKDISPAFAWAEIPKNAKALALVVSDPTASNGTFYHWVVYNIPTSVAEIPEGADKLPAGSLVAKNGFGKPRYNGPCPPKGSAHTYSFTLFALDNKLSIPASADGKTVTEAITKHMISKIEMTAVYSRWIN